LTTAKGSASSWSSQVGGGVKSVALGRFFFPLLLLLALALEEEEERGPRARRRETGTHCRSFCRNCC